MFSENNKISGRQVFRLLTYDFLGIGTLLIPTALAQYAGRDGIFCIVAGVLLGLIFLKILAALSKEMEEGYEAYLLLHCKKWGGTLLLFLYFIYFVTMASYAAYIFSTLVLEHLVQNVSFYLVLFLLLLLALYSMAGGIEGRARVYEILFWFLMIPLFLMLFAAAKEVQVSYWCPVFTSNGKNAITGSYYVFFCYSIISIVLFLREYVTEGKEKEVLKKNARRAVLFSGAVLLVLYLILLGMFGADALAEMRFPAVTMMSRVQISGGFLKRTDAFMFGIWFFTLYALLNSMIFYGGNLMLHGFMRCGGKIKANAKLLFYLAVLVLVYFFASAFYRNGELLAMVERLLLGIGTPFIAFVPIFLYLFSRLKKSGKGKGVAATVLLLGCLFLQGCNVAELEDKSFPVLLNIRAEGDFKKQWLNQKYDGNKIVDYNHLKVVLVEKDFLEDTAVVDEALAMLEKEKEVPLNAYVIATDNCDDIIQSGEDAGLVIGNYLEELIENASGVKKKVYPTIGMLYQERKNHLETLFIPYVGTAGEMPQVTGYEVWKRGSAAGLVDTETALASFFTQNEMEEYMLELAPEEYVKFTGISCHISQEEKLDKQGVKKQWVTVNVSAEGEVLSGTGSDGNKRNERLKEYLNAIAKKAQMQQIDITNSYKMLGENNREWYFKYKDRKDLYEQEIHINYLVKINWKNE